MTWLRSSDAVGELLVLIDIPEEASVIEARFEDSFIATLDQAFGIAAGIHHRNKVRREFAGRGFDREILLVVPHHRGQDFGGQFQEGRVEVAADRGGIFGDEGEGFDQIGVGLGAELRYFGDDLLAALVGGQDHEVLAELAFVSVKRDRDRRRSQNAMASRDVAALDAGQFEGDDLVIEQRHDPADGADETRAGFAAGPVHGLGPLDAEDSRGQRFGENIAHGAAWHELAEFVIVADLGHGREFDALLLGESGSGFVTG